MYIYNPVAYREANDPQKLSHDVMDLPQTETFPDASVYERRSLTEIITPSQTQTIETQH